MVCNIYDVIPYGNYLTSERGDNGPYLLNQMIIRGGVISGGKAKPMYCDSIGNDGFKFCCTRATLYV